MKSVDFFEDGVLWNFSPLHCGIEDNLAWECVSLSLGDDKDGTKVSKIVKLLPELVDNLLTTHTASERQIFKSKIVFDMSDPSTLKRIMRIFKLAFGQDLDEDEDKQEGNSKAS